jgi:ferrochelatase
VSGLQARYGTIAGAEGADGPRFDEPRAFDALLFLSFGGPEGHDDVMPFLEKVSGGRSIPRARLEEVAEHYHHFGGVSPINAQNRALIAALQDELRERGPHLRVYFGNRNWHPFVNDTVQQMHADGVRRALVLVTSAFSSYSGCRQYREDMLRAVDACVAAQGDAPRFDKLRMFYNQPGFLNPMIERTCAALEQVPPEQRAAARLVFTAHSVPLAMAGASDYVAQLEEAAQIIARGAGVAEHALVYQSRSGPPHIPWLEPDICVYLEEIHAAGAQAVVIVPIGFISDHMEVLFDLDTDAQAVAQRLGMTLVRAGTVGTHPDFVAMLRDLIVERMTPAPARPFLGTRGPNHDICPLDCCLQGERPRAHRPG